MKIYEFNFGNGTVKDWVFASDLKDAKKTHESFTGGCDLSDCKITKVPKKDWSTMYLLDTDEYFNTEDMENEDDYCNGYKIEMTFAEYAEKNFSSDFIASTEY